MNNTSRPYQLRQIRSLLVWCTYMIAIERDLTRVDQLGTWKGRLLNVGCRSTVNNGACIYTCAYIYTTLLIRFHYGCIQPTANRKPAFSPATVIQLWQGELKRWHNRGKVEASVWNTWLSCGNWPCPPLSCSMMEEGGLRLDDNFIKTTIPNNVRKFVGNF